MKTNTLAQIFKTSLQLSTVEGYLDFSPITTVPLVRVKYNERDDHLVVRLECSSEQKLPTYNGKELEFFILASRHVETHLFDEKSEWPIYVYMAVPKASQINLDKTTYDKDELELLGIGLLSKA